MYVFSNQKSAVTLNTGPFPNPRHRIYLLVLKLQEVFAFPWNLKSYRLSFRGLEHRTCKFVLRDPNYEDSLYAATKHVSNVCKNYLQPRKQWNHSFWDPTILLTHISNWAIARFPVAHARWRGVRRSSALTEIFISSQVHLAKHNVNALVSPLDEHHTINNVIYYGYYQISTLYVDKLMPSKSLMICKLILSFPYFHCTTFVTVHWFFKCSILNSESITLNWTSIILYCVVRIVNHLPADRVDQ